ncbi:MAG: polyprenyl synthetase family protein [Kosmotoga sp.]|nr:MAG: polyprenyl synthetase family protein [Kosmotoga sp.]
MIPMKKNLDRFSEYFDKKLKDYLDSKEIPLEFKETIKYTPLAGGKRLRPYLIHLFSEQLNIDETTILPLELAVEIFHSASLIHDDLPALDNDKLRRGKPSLHSVYGEGEALLAGDYLMLHAGHLIGSLEAKPECLIELNKSWSNTAENVVLGEYLDIRYKEYGKSFLDKIHRLKTGALFGFSFSSPFIFNGMFDKAKRYEEIGNRFGICFQIMDDIKDVTETSKTLGKTTGKDQKLNKPTILDRLSLSEAIEYSAHLFKETIQQIEYETIRNALDELKEIIEKS